MKKQLLIVALLMFAASSLNAQPTPQPTKKVAPVAKKAEPKAVPASAPTKIDAGDVPAPKDTPKDVGEAIDKGKEMVTLGKEGKWMAFSSAACLMLMFFIKLGRKSLGFMKNMKKRWLYIFIGVLSLAAMLLSKFQGDLSWGAAVSVLTSSASMALLSDLIKRGILGKEPSTSVNGETT